MSYLKGKTITEQAEMIRRGLTWLWTTYLLASLCLLGTLALGSLTELSTPWYIVQGMGAFGIIAFASGLGALWGIYKKEPQLAARINDELAAFNAQRMFIWAFLAVLITQIVIILTAQAVSLPASFAAFLTMLVIDLTVGVAALRFNRDD